MTLPKVERRDPDDRQRTALTLWLMEWALFKVLNPESTASDPGPYRPLSELRVLGRNDPIEPGDIRLLHPDIERDRLRYVAVTGPQEGGEWQVVPFGLLSEPATPEELRTERTTPSLRVLCAWNAFVLSEAMLQRCWLADRLTMEELNRLRVAMAESFEPSSTPEEEATRVGPPLQHPLDPRWDYLDMESDFRRRACRPVHNTVRYDASSGMERRKAAEDRTPYDTREGEPATDDDQEKW